MAIPPERITIKRRRDDEPVDTLYIQQKRQRSNYLWSRINSGEASIKDTAKREAEARIPIVGLSLPRDDARSQPSNLPRLPQSNTDALSASFAAQLKSVTSESSISPHIDPCGPKNQFSSNHASQPRTFHLSTSLASSSLRHVPQTRGILKPRKHRDDVAVFVEKTKRNPRVQDALRKAAKAGRESIPADGDRQQDNQGHEFEGKGHSINDVRSRSHIKYSTKRGDVTDSQPKSRQNIDGRASRWDPESSIPAGQLQLNAVNESSIHTQSSRLVHQPHPKIKPKPPRPRLQERRAVSVDSSGDEIMENTNVPENEDDFVYDTYIRTFGQLASIPMQPSEPTSSVLRHVDTSKIGILIITEQDESIWETFGEEEESDKDWNSEEEDENAENFYGNDYPEDEVNSDDEFGVGAYNHRNRASDDEEFVDDIARWSDEEEAARHPWNRHIGRDGDSDHEGGDD